MLETDISEHSSQAPVMPWYTSLTSDLAQWLQEFPKSIPEITRDANDVPDLFSFYASLCALETEVRSAARKAHESQGRFGENIEKLEGALGALREDMARLGVEKSLSTIDARDFLIPLADMRERMYRIASALSNHPRAGFIGGHERWVRHTESAQKAFALVEEQLEKTLASLGVRRGKTVGIPFDPRCMIAVGIDESGIHPDGVVAEEITAGYFHNDKILKPAEVTVARTRTGS